MSDPFLVPETVERLRLTNMTGEHLVQMFETLAAKAANEGDDSAALGVHYVVEGDTLPQGKFVPELYLVVNRIEDESLCEGP